MIAALTRAWEGRKAYLSKLAVSDTNAYRVFCGEKEGIPGLIADRYDQVLLLTLQEGIFRASDDELRSVAGFLIDKTGVRSVCAKRNLSDRSRASAQSTELLSGEPPDTSLVIRENGLRFLVRLNEAFSPGIFLDQRDNRRHLAELAQGRRVLNCFAYTCAFSVGAAKAGARVTSVDLSKKYLEWGKENFVLNQLDLAGHLFLARDVFRFFKAAEKRGETFDLLILDPPSFSRGEEGEVLSLRKDLRRLLAAALPLVAPGGHLFFSSNLSGWDSAYVRRVGTEVCQGRGKFEALPEAPEDFRLETSPLSSFLLRL